MSFLKRRFSVTKATFLSSNTIPANPNDVYYNDSYSFCRSDYDEDPSSVCIFPQPCMRQRVRYQYDRSEHAVTFVSSHVAPFFDRAGGLPRLVLFCHGSAGYSFRYKHWSTVSLCCTTPRLHGLNL